MRFPTKEALFAAVGERTAAQSAGQFDAYAPKGATTEEQLVEVGVYVLERLLANETIEFMRMSAAEARRFPELVTVGSRARERGARAVAQALREIGQRAGAESFLAFAPERLAETAGFFIDLVVARLLLRALFGEDLKALRGEIGEQVTRSVRFFLDACRRNKIKP